MRCARVLREAKALWNWNWNLKQRCDLPGQDVDGRDFRRGKGMIKGTEARKQLMGSLLLDQTSRKAEWESVGLKPPHQSI